MNETATSGSLVQDHLCHHITVVARDITMESLVGKPNYLGRRHRFATTTNRVIMASNSITSATTYPTYMSASTSSLATFLLLFFYLAEQKNLESWVLQHSHLPSKKRPLPSLFCSLFSEADSFGY